MLSLNARFLLRKVMLSPVASTTSEGYRLVDYSMYARKHQLRIFKNVKALSKAGVAPKIISVSNGKIKYEKVTCYSEEEGFPSGLKLSMKEIHDAYIAQVEKMHSLGYAHGDLGPFQLAFTEDQRLVFVGWTYCFSIAKDRNREWLRKWREEWFSDMDTHEKFVANDFSIRNDKNVFGPDAASY